MARVRVVHAENGKEALVKISSIAVHGLFDRFNHELTFNPSERITIMIGPNGYGKTTILRILNVLFNHSPRSLGRMPFEELHVDFDDGSRLAVAPSPLGPSPQLSYVMSRRETAPYVPEPLSRWHEASFPIGMIEDVVPSLERIGVSDWRNVLTGEVLDLDDVIETYADMLPFIAEKDEQRIPSWLKDIRESLPVRFIDTERLTDLSAYRRRLRSQSSYSQMAPERTVRLYSKKLAGKVQKTLTQYATLSQSLDRSFPARLVEEPKSVPLSKEQVAQDLKEVDRRRSAIIEAGLLPQEHASLSVPNIDSINDSRIGVLAVYAQDATEKLNVFEDLYLRVNTFVRIANARLLHKQISVSQEGLKVSNSDGASLELEMLSSGEQHELVLLFDLLFGTKKNSLIMVDEPELSLHVTWQRELLKDLQEMAELSDFRVLLATHSPQIIGDRWDLTIQLQGPDKE